MPRPNVRPPTWLLALFLISGLGLVLVTSCKHVPLLASSVCAVIGSFLVIASVASIGGIAVSQHAAQIVGKLFGRRGP
jgi:hypothetical protein